jgi:hypothetical protein
MAITDIPGSYEEPAAFMGEYEARHFAPSAGGHKVALADRDRMAGDSLPLTPLWLSRRIVGALIPDHMRLPLGLPAPSRATRLAAQAFLKARAAFL